MRSEMIMKSLTSYSSCIDAAATFFARTWFQSLLDVSVTWIIEGLITPINRFVATMTNDNV